VVAWAHCEPNCILRESAQRRPSRHMPWTAGQHSCAATRHQRRRRRPLPSCQRAAAPHPGAQPLKAQVLRHARLVAAARRAPLKERRVPRLLLLLLRPPLPLSCSLLRVGGRRHHMQQLAALQQPGGSGRSAAVRGWGGKHAVDMDGGPGRAPGQAMRAPNAVGWSLQSQGCDLQNRQRRRLEQSTLSRPRWGGARRD
jgi:hypothetical protein